MSPTKQSRRVVLAVTSPSTFLGLNGTPILLRIFDSLRNLFPNHRIIVAVSGRDASTTREILGVRVADCDLLISETLKPAVLAHSLKSLIGEISSVLIHDASRPLTSRAQFDEVLAAFDDETDAVRPAIAFTETLKILDANSMIKKTLDRSSVLRISTPEIIRVSAIDFTGHENGWFLPLRDGARTLHVTGHPSGIRMNTAEDQMLMELGFI